MSDRRIFFARSADQARNSEPPASLPSGCPPDVPLQVADCARLAGGCPRSVRILGGPESCSLKRKIRQLQSSKLSLRRNHRQSRRGPAGKGLAPAESLSKILLKGVSRNTILAAVENVDVGSVIIGLLKSKREQVRLEALHFIFDRVIGKPKQDLSLTGGIVHAHTRDPLLASLPKEALDALALAYDEVLSKHVPVITPDAPPITLESKRLPEPDA